MANEFTYRAEPPCRLVADTGLQGPERAAALMRQQAELGLSVGVSGRYWSTSELMGDPSTAAIEAGFARVLAEVAAMAIPGGLPIKVGLPAPARARVIDRDAFAAGLAKLVEAGVLYLQLDGAGYAAWPAPELLAADVALLAEVPRVEGLVTGIDLGPASTLGDQAEPILAAIKTDRVTLSFSAHDRFDVLNYVPEGVLVVLGLVDPERDDSNDAILERIDAAAEVIDGDRLALTTTRGFADREVAAQAAKLGQIADVNTMFWGFAM